MEVESRQVEILDQFCLLAKNTKGRGTAELINKAISEPNLFAFAELLELAQVKELQGTELNGYFELLHLFSSGTWTDYKSRSLSLPSLSTKCLLKLKQLTVMTLAESTKTLSYGDLMHHLDLNNIRELEDFLINHCIYTGIVHGKLNQKKRIFEIQFSVARDLKFEQIQNLEQILNEWLHASENVLINIKENIKHSDTQNELKKIHKKEVEEKCAEMKENIRMELQIRGQLDSTSSFNDGLQAASMEFEEDRGVKPKRRR